MSGSIVAKLVKIPKKEIGEISKAVVIAKNSEREAKEFYERFAQKTMDLEMKKAMESLAREEQEHFDSLDAVEKALKKDGKFAVVTKNALKHFEKPRIIPGKNETGMENKNELSALLWAMRAERKAEAFYWEQAGKTKTPEAKAFWKTLAEFEKGHFEYLDGMVSAMTSTADFILG